VGRLAILIPSVGSVEALETTLVAVLQNRPPKCDVIVVHAHPYDDPYELADEVQFVAAPASASYLNCVERGLQLATGSVIHVLAAGCNVNEGWTDGVLRHFNDPRVAAVAPLLLAPHNCTTAIAADVNYLAGGMRSAQNRPVDQMQSNGVSPVLAASPLAAFYNRYVLETIGPMAVELGLDGADVDLGLRLKHAGFQTLVDPRCQVTLPERSPEKVSAFEQAMRAERLFWRNAPLAGWGRALVTHPLAVLASVVTSLPFPSAVARLAGHIVGLTSLPAARRYHRRLADLHNSAPQPVHQPKTLLRMDRAHAIQPSGNPKPTTPTAKAA
jgi:hypothetical protein